MKAKIVTNYDQVKEFYYYKKSEPPKPLEYPCVMSEEDCDGGIGGSYYHYEFHYPLGINNENVEDYFLGLIKGLSYAD